MILTAVGVTVGIVGAVSVTRVMQSLLFDVGALDRVTFIAVPAILVTAAVLAAD